MLGIREGPRKTLVYDPFLLQWKQQSHDFLFYKKHASMRHKLLSFPWCITELQEFTDISSPLSLCYKSSLFYILIMCRLSIQP